MSSLRSRVLFGAGLWTIGLIAVLGIAFPLLFIHGDAVHHLRVEHLRSFPIALHESLLAVVAIACMIAGLALVRASLVPFDNLRSRLNAVRRGSRSRLEGSYPSEVQPLVDELNAFLEHNEQVVARATAKAGDLAHGLKTPLTVLSNEAERLARGPDADLAAVIDEQVGRMRRQVEYHLAHAGAAAAGTVAPASCPIAASVAGIVRTLLRLHEERGVQIAVRVDPAHRFRGRREDLDEILGNVLDNACKWARSRVEVESSMEGERAVVVVGDDGPGIDAAVRDAVLRRGVRADEATPGSGLGLAIVRELTDLYGGTISLDSSPLGGLSVRIVLPA